MGFAWGDGYLPTDGKNLFDINLLVDFWPNNDKKIQVFFNGCR
jgi:hypothetical protein